MGIDEYEIQVDVTEEPSPEVVAEKASVQLRRRKKEMVLASAIPANQTLINDYDSAWLVGAHPTVFPWKTGGRHKDGPLSEKKWCNLLLRRYPRKQFAQNPAFIADMFNILQRHSVNTNAAVAFRFSPSQSAKIANISEDAINGVIDLIKHRAYGNDLFNKLQALGEVVHSIVSIFVDLITANSFTQEMALALCTMASNLPEDGSSALRNRFASFAAR